MTHREDMLAKAQADLGAFHKRHFPVTPADGAMINLPLRVRSGSLDAEIDKFNRLTARVEYWHRKVRAERNRTEAPERKAAEQAAHTGADLKARYDGCTEALWSLSGNWLPVVRWNRKTVTVDMRGSRESIPHDQVAGAR